MKPCNVPAIIHVCLCMRAKTDQFIELLHVIVIHFHFAAPFVALSSGVGASFRSVLSDTRNLESELERVVSSHPVWVRCTRAQDQREKSIAPSL